MENSNTNPMHSEGVSGTCIDWRTHMPFAARQKIVNKIVEWLVKYSSGEPQETTRFEDMASKFEEKVFSIAKNKDDYRRMIHAKLQQHKNAQRQRSLTSSAPGHTYFVESSLQIAASPLPQFPGHGQPMEIQPGLQKHPSSVVMHPLPHQRPIIYHQETSNFNLQQQQDPNAVNSWLNAQQKTVPDLRNQHTLYGLDRQSDRNMHQLGQQISSSVFNKQFSNFGTQSDQRNIVKISSNNLEVQQQAQQAQPTSLQTLGLQPGSQLLNTSQMRVQQQQNVTQVMAEVTSQTSHSAANDWKEELYNKITKLRNLFLPALMVQQGKMAERLQKLDCIPHHERSGDEYVILQKQLHVHKKVCSFLNFKKDQMSEEIRIWFPACEKLVGQLLQGRRSQGHISSPQQKQLPKSDAQSTKNPVLLQPQVEDGQLQQCRMTDNLVLPKEQRAMQHHQQSVNFLAHHSSKFNQALNVNRIQEMESETGKNVHNKCVGNRLLSNAQLEKVNSQPVSTPCKSSNDFHMNNLEKSSQIIGQHRRSPFSVDPPSTCSVQTSMKENQSLGANTGDVHPQETSGSQASDRSLVISVSGISPSGLLAETVDGNGNQRHDSTKDLSESSVPEQPIQRLLKAVRSSSHNTFSASVGDMKSIVRSSQFSVGEDLATATPFYCGLGDNSSQKTHRNFYVTASPSGMRSDGLNPPVYPETFHLDSLIVNPYKKPRIEVNWNLLEEISEINLQLIETVVEISEDNVISITEETLTKSDQGTVVRCIYTPVTASLNMKSELASFQTSPIKPLKLFVPISYPSDSPVIMDKSLSETSTDCEELSAKAKSKLKLSLRFLRQPMSLADIARTWETCARAVISEFAQKSGGGNFSSTYGTWVSYPSAA